MLPHDSEDIIRTVLGLWPRWEPTAEQEAVWTRALEAMPDSPALLPRLKLAIDKAYADQTGNWKEPKLAKIREALLSIRGGDAEAQEAINGLTGVWIIRLDNRGANAIPQGRTEIPLGRAIDIANEWKEEHTETYGGEWVVVPQEGQERAYTPHRARALAKTAYADKLARMDAANRLTLAAGRKPALRARENSKHSWRSWPGGRRP